MFIQTEKTPNPNALKFLPGSIINNGQPIHFSNITEAEEKSILAVKLFTIEGVKGVFFGYNFITVTKNEEVDWQIIKAEVLMTIMDYLIAELPVFHDLTDTAGFTIHPNATEIEKQIIEIIETRVRPSVAMDGGDITYKSFENGVVKLALRGSCAGCPSSAVTLKNGIESMLKHFIPEVEMVEAVEEEI